MKSPLNGVCVCVCVCVYNTIDLRPSGMWEVIFCILCVILNLIYFCNIDISKYGCGKYGNPYVIVC